MSLQFGPTGDTENAFKKLARVLMRVRYPDMFARERVLEGDTATLIPMLRYALASLSHRLARHLLNKGYAVYATGDAAFVEAVYRVCVHTFHYHPVLSLLQFMHTKGYAERKMAFVTAVLQCAINKHAELTKEAKAESQKAEAGSRSTSTKKAREEAQARLTQPRNVSSDAEGADDATPARSIRRSLSVSRTATSSASRARSASASRGSSLASSQRSRKSSAFATRPSTAATPAHTGAGGSGMPVDLYASTNSTSSFHNAFAPGRTHQQQHQQQYEAHDLTIDSMAPHSVARSTRSNGDVLDLHASSSQSHSMRESRPHPATVKKAWVHEHQGGSVNVSVVGYLEQAADGQPAPSPPKKDDAHARAKAAEYTRAQDLEKLKRREEQEEEDRLRLLHLQHQEYAMQNSPHIDHAEAAYQREQHMQQQYHDDDDDDQGMQQQHQPPRPFGVVAAFEQQLQSPARHMTQYQQLAASQRDHGSGLGQSMGMASPSPHLVGDEHGLNASFARSASSSNAGGAGFAQSPANDTTAAAPPQRPEIPKLQLGALNEQLSQIADRNQAVAKKVAQSSAKKQPRSTQQQAYDGHEQIPVLQFEPARNSQPDSSAPAPAPAPSASSVSSFLTAAAPSLSTPLETRLFSMLEVIQQKMSQMETNMKQMEAKLVKAEERGKEVEQKEHNDTQQREAHQQQQSQQQQQMARPTQHVNASQRPPASGMPSASLGTSFRSQHPNATPILNPLLPHPTHLYTPATSFAGATRGDNVNQLTRQPYGTQQTHAHPPPHAHAQLSHAYPHLNSSHTSVSHSRHGSPSRYSNLQPQPATTGSPQRGAGGPTNSFAHSVSSTVSSRLYAPPQQVPQRGATPVKVPLHAPTAYAPQGGDLLPSQSPTVQLGTPSSYPLLSHDAAASSSASSSSSVPVSMGSFAHSSHNVSHGTSGSASLSRDTVLPSTDLFIEQLKQRLKQTEELIQTARMTARNNNSDNVNVNAYTQ